jgi:hypothetical protein
VKRERMKSLFWRGSYMARSAVGDQQCCGCLRHVGLPLTATAGCWLSYGSVASIVSVA